MTSDWTVYPWQVDALVERWSARHPDLVEVVNERQYTRHRVHAITVTSPGPRSGKAEHLFMVPHAHEPAGTAACMNFIQQLLTGKHSSGAPSTLQRDRILEQCVLTFIPDGNPFGRSRCPEPVWEGHRYSNREFINMVFGIGDVHAAQTTKPHWERLARVSAFHVDDDPPPRIGLAYEPVSDHDYVETGRSDPRATISKLLTRLFEDHPFDQALDIHQTEFEGALGVNCKVVLPASRPDDDPAVRAALRSWAERVHAFWQSTGGRPPAAPQEGFPHLDDNEHLHGTGPALSARRELHDHAATITIEVQNNNPRTPAEEQVLLVHGAIVTSIEVLLERHGQARPQRARGTNEARA